MKDGTSAVLGVNNTGAKWITSKVATGNGHGAAYMNPDIPGISMSGYAWYPAAVNLDFGSSVQVSKIDKISKIIPKNASLVQNETAYHISMRRYANPPSTAAFIPHFGEHSFSLRHDIARTKPVIP